MPMLGQIFKGAVKLSTLGCETGFHMTRYNMYHNIEKALQGLDEIGDDILSISWSSDLVNLLHHKHPRVTDAIYPQESILHLSYPDESFDYVFSDQVLEHVEGNPQQAIDETRRVLRPGGIAIHTTCLMQEIHGFPQDYWRFTPHGLRHLFRDWSQIIEAASWGNKLALFGLRYIPVPHARWHPLHRLAMWNQPESAMATWIIAKK